MKTYFKAGSWNAVCMVCGFRFKAQELMKRWDGLMVCEKDYELDHPQKYLRVQSDPKPVPFVSPEQETFVAYCDLWSSSPMADFGEADCAVVGGNTSLELLIQSFLPTCIAGIAITGRSIPGVEIYV